MSIHTVTCGDLALLGGRWDALHQHNPRHMDSRVDTVCHCYMLKPPISRDAECRDLLRIPVGPDYVLVLCCLCAPLFRDGERGIRDEALKVWLAAQVEEAIRYREERRLATGPTVADMDWRERVLRVAP